MHDFQRVQCYKIWCENFTTKLCLHHSGTASIVKKITPSWYFHRKVCLTPVSSETCFLLLLLIPVTGLVWLCFSSNIPPLKLSAFLLTTIAPVICQGYPYYLPVNMWKCLSPSKLWDLLSITYQSIKLCLLENVNEKSAELKTVACEWLKFKSCFCKNYPFSTSFSSWSKRNPDCCLLDDT